jgi:ATP-dependent DNA helicase RecQ
MAELNRLKALDQQGDWSDFAILARNRATLDPIRAWCHLNKVAYRLSERDGSGPKFHQTREACHLLDLLRRKANRRVRPAVLSRWFAARFTGVQGANPWLLLLGQFIEEINCVWEDLPVPSGTLIDELYEFGTDAARSDRGRLAISTVHSAKGREFRHVVMLDGGDWRDASDDERRLYYVGMTRAKETLLLCESVTSPNPFSIALVNPGIVRIPVPEDVARPPELRWRYVSLGLSDVDLGYAGRKPVGHAVHRALQSLEHGDFLTVSQSEQRVELLDPQSGGAVGALAKSIQLPPGEIVTIHVDTLIRRSCSQSNPQFAHMVKVETWWVPLVTLTIAPGR